MSDRKQPLPGSRSDVPEVADRDGRWNRSAVLCRIGLALACAVVAASAGCETSPLMPGLGRYSDDPVLQHLYQYREQLQQQKRQVAAVYGRTNPAVRNIELTIRHTEEMIQARREFLDRQARLRATRQDRQNRPLTGR